MIPSLQLDFNDVAKRIDSFLANDCLFKLFGPEDVIEIIKRTDFTHQSFVTFIQHMRAFYDEPIIIKILLEMKEILLIDKAQNLEIIKIILETIDIPVLTKIYSQIIKPKSKQLKLSDVISFEANSKIIPHDEFEILTFAEPRWKGYFSKSPALIIRLIYQNKTEAIASLKKLSLDIDIIKSELFFCCVHGLMHAVKFYLDYMKNNNIEIDFTQVTHAFILASSIEGLNFLVNNGIEISGLIEEAFTCGHLHIVKYYLHEFPDIIEKQKEELFDIIIKEEHYHLIECLQSGIYDEDYQLKELTESMKNKFNGINIARNIAINYNDMEYFKIQFIQNNESMHEFLQNYMDFQNYKDLDKLLQQNFIRMMLTQRDKEQLLMNSFECCLEIIETTFKYLYEPLKFDYYHVLFHIWDFNVSRKDIFEKLYEKIPFSEDDLFVIMAQHFTDVATQNFIQGELVTKYSGSNRLRFHPISIGCLDEDHIYSLTFDCNSSIGTDEFRYLLQSISGIDIDFDIPEDLNVTADNDLDALCLSCRCGNTKNIENLITLGFDVNRESRNNHIRPIHIACKYGHLNVVKLLSKNKCDLSACNSSHRSPMDYAVVGGYPQIIEFLLGNGIKINTDFCIAHGHFLSLDYLIKNSMIATKDINLTKMKQNHREDIYQLLKIKFGF